MRRLAISLVVLATTWIPSANAQQYPSKPVTIIVPFGPGGTIDTQVRLLARKMPDFLNGTAVIVENKPGAASQLGIEYVARQPADGYTLVAITASIAVLPVTNSTFTLDPVRGLSHITLFSRGPHLLTVNNAVPGNALKDFVNYAKANPGKLKFGTSGLGDRSIGEYFEHVAGIKLVTVPYNSAPGQLQSLLNNDIQMIFLPSLSVMGFINDGKARALAISTGKRTDLVPGVPTIAESGYPGFDLGFWFGLSGPPGLPLAVVETIHKAVLSALRDPDVVKAINLTGSDIVGSSPEELAAAIDGDRKLLTDIAKEIMAGAK